MDKYPHLSGSIMSRRSALRLLGAAPAAAALALAGPGTARARSARAGQLNIYSWPDYFSTADLQAYAKAAGFTPTISTYASNEMLFTKLRSPAGVGYDLVIPSSSWIEQFANHGLLEEIDHSRLNLASLDPNLMNRVYDRNNKYSIPKDWGLLGVLYSPEAVKDEIHTWDDFFRAGEKPGVSGKIRLSVSGWETIGPELWLQGKDWNTVGEADIRTAARRLMLFAKHVRTFSGLDPNAVANGSIVLAQTHQSAARAAITLNPKLVREVKVTNIALLEDSTAVVEFSTSSTQSPSDKPVVQKYALTFRYQIVPPTSEDALGANPFGVFYPLFTIQKTQ